MCTHIYSCTYSIINYLVYLILLRIQSREFPGGPVVRTQCFHSHGLDSIPGQGTKTLQAMEHGQIDKGKIKQ